MTDTHPQTSAAAPDADSRAVKILNERLWHFTSVGLGNCRAAQRVRREIEHYQQSQAAADVSPLKLPSNIRSGNGADSRRLLLANAKPPPNPLANQTIEQLTAGLAHLESVGLANSRAAELNRRELRRRITLNPQLATLDHLRLANADFDSQEPRDRRGQWTTEGNASALNTNSPSQAVNPSPIAIPHIPSSVSCIAGGKPLELAPPPDFRDIREALINFWNSISTPLFPELLPANPEEQRPREKPMPPNRLVSTPGGVMIVRDPGPNPLLPRPPKRTVATGVLNGLGDLVRGFTSPIGIATLGIGGLPRTAQRIIALLFAGQMLKQTPDLAKQLGTELGKPPEQQDKQKIAQLITTGAGSLGFGALAAAHGLKPTPETPPGSRETQTSPEETKAEPTYSQEYLDAKYPRVKLNEKILAEIWERSKAPDGKVYDPSGVEIKPGERWQPGHRPAHKFSDAQQRAARQNMDTETWKAYQRDPDIYRPERPRTNLGHRYESDY